MKNTVDVYIRIEDGGRMPIYASKHAAGCDLFATMDMAIAPGETKIMPLNFSMAMEEGVEAQIRPRSGLSLKTMLRLPNSPGTIDSDYRDTVGVILHNDFNIANLPYLIVQKPEILEELCNDYKEVPLAEYLSSKNVSIPAYAYILNIAEQKIYIDANGNPFGTIYIKKGERIAQMIFSQHKRANFIEHHDPRSIGEDRGGGFGHTGVASD